MELKAIISGGGTAGHINPALAIAGHLEKYHNAEILFVGTPTGMESTLVPKAGYPMETVVVEGLIRKLTFKNVKVLYHFIKAVSDAKKIIRKFGPDIVIGTSGYVCAPVMVAAHKLGIPTLIHEQNVIPGFTVKLTASIVDAIAISFSDTTKYFKPKVAEKCFLTGNPLRENMLDISYEEARARLELDLRPFVVALGGSLGARAVNQAVAEYINSVDASKVQVLAATGKRYYDEFMGQVDKEKLSDSIRVEPYIYNMEEVLPAADVVIARAGALTIGELTALGRPSILIPSPNVAHDHQTYNAKSLASAGAAVLIPESELSAEKLKKEIDGLLSDEQKREEMSKNAKKLGITDGAKRIAARVCELIKSKAEIRL
ncbi:MAG: undecaprenyldiphospho-muramoylpentapeptide beta-N-acetylglucosaminyltransferase [Clostridia bacterium]|nr:undecaprenyldiphospho-muramoylpentapeptide beta-N-acetylglucosaminyltransferase [Clostridia bacterium]